jgi:hypothetical protein
MGLPPHTHFDASSLSIERQSQKFIQTCSNAVPHFITKTTKTTPPSTGAFPKEPSIQTTLVAPNVANWDQQRLSKLGLLFLSYSKPTTVRSDNNFTKLNGGRCSSVKQANREFEVMSHMREV